MVTPTLFLLQVISKTFDYDRSKILKEIDIFHHCQGHSNILQLNEYYEESEKFYLVFDMLKGGWFLALLTSIAIVLEGSDACFTSMVVVLEGADTCFTSMVVVVEASFMYAPSRITEKKDSLVFVFIFEKRTHSFKTCRTLYC